MNIFVQIFIYADVFIIGIIAEIVYRHAYAHYHPAIKVKPQHQISETIRLTQSTREKLLLEAEQKFQIILQHSADQLTKDLGVTAERINVTVKKLSADIITKELEGFQQLFRDYQVKTSQELESTKTQTAKYQEELKAKLDEQATAEKQRLVATIDNKLSDVIMSFLADSMQHEVDLGGQMDYLMSTLEDHKAEFKKAIND